MPAEEIVLHLGGIVLDIEVGRRIGRGKARAAHLVALESVDAHTAVHNPLFGKMDRILDVGGDGVDRRVVDFGFASYYVGRTIRVGREGARHRPYRACCGERIWGWSVETTGNS